MTHTIKRKFSLRKSHKKLITTLSAAALLSLSGTSFAEVSLLEESKITEEGLYFWYANGRKAWHYNANISPRGDCVTVVNGYIYFGWWKGGMDNRALMLSRKKIGSGDWVSVEFPHQNTLIQPGDKWGDSHRTISVAVSEKDGTVHLMYDHHNDPLNYIISKKNIAFAADNKFELTNFEPTREYLAKGQNVRITYPTLVENDKGDVVLHYRKGSAVGGNEMVHSYNGDVWTKSKQVTRGGGKPHVAIKDKNYAYGKALFGNGDIYYAFSVRWAAKKSKDILNEGVYLAKTGPTMTSQWEDPTGVKHNLPIQDYSPFLIDLPKTNNNSGSSGGVGISVSDNGGVHLSYRGRGNDKQYHYTYTRKADEKTFTKHSGHTATGIASGNKLYSASATSDGVITIKSADIGSVTFKTELTLNTPYEFGVSTTRIEDGKLVLIAADRSIETDAQNLFSYVFDLGNAAQDDSTAQTTGPAIKFSRTKITLDEGYTNLSLAVTPKDSKPNNAIRQVKLFIDDKLIRQENKPPFEWGGAELLNLTPGTHNIVAIAKNKNGDQGQVSTTVTVEAKPRVIEVDAEQGNYKAINLLDNDKSDESRWSAQYYNKSVTFDLGKAKKITGTRMWTYAKRAYQYQVWVSQSPTSGFTLAASKNKNTSAVQPLKSKFNKKARYVKLVITGAHNYDKNWVSINEFTIDTE